MVYKLRNPGRNLNAGHDDDGDDDVFDRQKISTENFPLAILKQSNSIGFKNLFHNVQTMFKVSKLDFWYLWEP